MNIIFYQYDGDPATIKKTLKDGYTVEGYLYDGADVLNPRLKIEADAATFEYNYFYIEDLERYYFVDAVRIEDTNFLTITAHEDCLKTFADDILNAYALIVQDEAGSPFISTADTTHDTRATITRIDFNNPFNERGNILMLTIKGTGATTL